MKFFPLVFAWLLGHCTLFAQSAHKHLRKGDQAYTRDQYKIAEKHYRSAADLNYSEPQAVYNLGNALYKQGNWEDAAQRYAQAANNAKTTGHRADALHNLGNALLKQRKFEQAVGAYEESLRLRPADPDTKMNLQMARKKLREEQQKQREKEQQNQQQQPNDPQNADQPPTKSPQNGEDTPNSPPQESPAQQPSTPPPSEPKQDRQQELKKGEAKKLLETAIGAEDRKNAQKYRAAQQQSGKKGSRKDW